MSNEVLEKLAQLLEQDQFELIFTEQDIRLVYLMNDAVESFLVFQNVRMTGEYKDDYEGELEVTLEKQGQKFVLIVHQGDTVVKWFSWIRFSKNSVTTVNMEPLHISG